MNITPETKKLLILFGLQSSERYIIPEYQRNYSWKNQQIDTLFSDILEEELGYYVGNLLLINYNNDTFDVIDGQQRLTTISLFLLAIYEKLNDFGSEIPEKDKEDLYSVKRDIKRMLFNSKNEQRVTLLDKDNNIWTSLLTVLTNSSAGKYGKWSFYKRYKYIKESLVEKLETHQDVLDFFNKLINLELLSIKVNNISDAYKAFSSLNSKGLPLTQLDLLKVEYLRSANEYHKVKPHLKWDELMSVFQYEDDGEYDSRDIQKFLLDNYDTFEAKGFSSITKSQIINKYQSFFKSPDYINVLIKNSKYFTRIIKPSDDNEINKKLLMLNKLDGSQSYPLIMFMLDKNYEDAFISAILDNLIVFFLRRNVCQKPKASNIRAKILEIIRKISIIPQDNYEGIFNEITNTLKHMSESDEYFIKQLAEEPIYDIHSNSARHILINIERANNKTFNKENPDTFDEKDQKNNYIWTLEHILPKGKNMPPVWEEELKPLPEDIDIESILAMNVHLLGNLTLTGYNPELSNKSFNDKKFLTDGNGNPIGLQNRLFLNRYVVKTDKWNLDEINNRSSDLANEACRIYQFKSWKKS